MRSGLLLTTAAALLIGTASAARATVGFTTLDDSSDTGGSLVASGINNSGQIVGSYSNGSTTVGFSLSGGSYSDVYVTGSAMTAATGVNNAGLITGYYQDSTLNAVYHGFTQTALGAQSSFDYAGSISTSATLGSATNDHNTTVGTFSDNSGTHGFIGTSTTVDGPSAVFTQAFGINNAGTVVGDYATLTQTNAFVDSGGGPVQLVNPIDPSFSTVATGIDSRGDIVGYYTDGGNATHGFVDVLGSGTFIQIDAPTADGGTQILGVNDDDMIVGSYVSQGVTYGFVAYDSDLPEPGTFALFGLATLGVIALRRRQVLGI
jgi:hypothetical protein